ncbi:hypothetical protein LCGC14_2728450 [marine sediment metagenome]|uniref:Uncharacterized protein n=1 Tax=marine sediment metagenome TaxID=412755 RepID=A0A0F9BZS2_9ZZZZ
MNERFESLAKAIFDHDNSGLDCPVAPWDQQCNAHKDRYRTAAMVCRLITLGPIYSMDMLPVAEPSTAPYPNPTGPNKPESVDRQAPG